MSVNGCDTEIFITASGVFNDKETDQMVRLEFFSLSADENDTMTQ